MRHTALAASLSWIPSHSMTSAAGRAIDLGISHADDPPPGRLEGPEHIRRLEREDRFRFANVIGLWVDVEGVDVVRAGAQPESSVVMGSTTLRLGALGVTFPAVPLPVLRGDAEIRDGVATLRQTAGGRTGAPLPRPIPRRPFVQWWAPIVWTTLELELRSDGASDVRLVGASPFPRHWVYDAGGDLATKSGVTEERRWLETSFGTRTPWGDGDSAAVTSAIESDLERRLSRALMSGHRPEIRRLDRGDRLTEQGDRGDELFLLLDGILSVVVDGDPIAEVGPGAVLGERAILEHGRRTATLTASTPARVAVAPADALDHAALAELAAGHRRERGRDRGAGLSRADPPP